VASDVGVLARDLGAEARQITHDELGGAARKVVTRAVRDAPIDTGFFRADLQLRSEPAAGFAGRWRITDSAWYAGYVRAAGSRRTVVQRLLLDPLQVEVPKAAQAIADRIGRK
jgi:hypothetical protein